MYPKCTRTEFQQVFLREVFFECGVQFIGLFSRAKKKNIEIRNGAHLEPYYNNRKNTITIEKIL